MASGQNFGVTLSLLPYFVYPSSKGSAARIYSVNTKISCASLFLSYPPWISKRLNLKCLHYDQNLFLSKTAKKSEISISSILINAFVMIIFYSAKSVSLLTLCILLTTNWVLWQTVKTQIKCRLMRHFISSTLFTETKMIFRERNTFFFEIITCDPLICTMDYPKFNASNQKEEYISAYWLKITMLMLTSHAYLIIVAL